MPYKDPELAKAKAAARYQAKKEELKAKAKARYYENREARLEQVKAHYEQNREKVAQYKSEYQARPENRAKERARAADRYRNDPDYRARMRSTCRARQYKIRNADLTTEQRSEIAGIYAEAERLTIETGVPHEVDHIIPLAKGGLHAPWNLQVLTRYANRSKGATM